MRNRQARRSSAIDPPFAARNLSPCRVTHGRRWWLSTVMAAGCAYVIRPRCLQALATELRPLRFLVVSDTHLGYAKRDGAERRWKQTAAELAAAPGELVLHLGDIVDRGQESQYAVYKAQRDLIGKPVHEIPGNHDPAELFAKHIRGAIDTVVELDWLRFLLLNNARVGSHDGFLDDRQLAWLENECRTAEQKKQFVIMAMHVPAHTNRHPDRGWYIKPEHGQAALYALLAKHADRILALFHGHFHNGIRGWDDHESVHEICFPSALYNQNRRLEVQQAPGYNVDEFRPGFTQVSIEEGELRLQYKPVGAPVSRLKRRPLKQM